MRKSVVFDANALVFGPALVLALPLAVAVLGCWL